MPPDESKHPSETVRIDLLQAERKPGVAPQAQPPVPHLARMHWSRPSRLLDSVVRSRYQELLQSVYDAALISDLGGQIVDANGRAAEFFQFGQADLCRMAVYEIIAGADESLMETLSENLKNERFTVIQAFCIRRDGSSFPAEIAVNKLRLDKLRLCFFVRDVTVRMQAEETLRKEHTAIQNSGNGIVIADLAAKLEYANPAFARMLGHAQPDVLIGRDMRDFLSDRETAEGLMQHVMQTNAPWMREMKMRKLDGGELYVQVSAACSRNVDGEPVGIVFSFADVTAHRQTEEALRAAQLGLEQQGALQECRRENELLRQELADLKKAGGPDHG